MDKFLKSVIERDFDRRISEVVEMLEEKQLYGTISLIKDLKYYLNLAIEEKCKAIDNFQNELKFLFDFLLPFPYRSLKEAEFYF